MGRIPIDLDILIMDEIGKNISGAGMDTKVVNRERPRRVQSVGHSAEVRAHIRARHQRAQLRKGVGLGMADMCTDGCWTRSTGCPRPSIR